VFCDSFQRHNVRKLMRDRKKDSSLIHHRVVSRHLIVAALILLVTPALVFAHARLLRSTPSAGARLESPPASIRLVFSEIPMAAVSKIVLIAPNADTVRLAAVRVDPADRHAILADVQGSLDSGKYTVHWSAAGSDGHPSAGSFTFTIGRAAPTSTAESAAAPVAPTHEKPITPRARRIDEAVQFALGAPMWTARWIGFVALFLVIGAVSFRYVVLGRIPRSDLEPDEPFYHMAAIGASTAGMIAAVVLVVTSVLKLYAETVAMRDVAARTILFATSWGWAWLAEITACVIAVVAFAAAHRVGNNRGSWTLAAICALTLAVTPALTGHAIGSDDAIFAVPLDGLHVLAGSAWLGTLAMILFVGVGVAAKAPGAISIGSRVAALINAFSPLALVCGGVVVATGIAASLLHLSPISRLWTSTYGMTLIVKLALVSLLFSLGAWNWRRVKPNLGGDEGVIALRFSAKLELTASILVLAVTAFLVALPLPE
jgi:copper transport protein